MYELDKIKLEIESAMIELLEESNLNENDIFVVGCSTSEVAGNNIGTHSVTEIASTIIDTILPILKAKQIFLATQCCEHLNRALVIEKNCAKHYNLEEVSVVPIPKAGGSLAADYYKKLTEPVVVEEIKANAGIDIGDTFIGMHIKSVAIPVRLKTKIIGCAHLTAVKRRPKFIGGERSVYTV